MRHRADPAVYFCMGLFSIFLLWGSSTPLRLPPASPGAAPRMGARYCAPHASGPATGAGVSGAPPTETGPTGLGSGGRVAGRTGGETGRNNFRDAWTTRARGCGRGMLEVIGGGPAGPGGPLAALKAFAKAATPAQRAEIQRGAKSITKLAAAIQAAVR